MDTAQAAHRLAQALRDDRLVALVGSGASAQTRDQSGRTYAGLPTPQDFVRHVARRRPYVDPDTPFVDACDQLHQHEGRSILEDLLVAAFDAPPSAEIPPAHKILAWLPFAAYVTSNYDRFLEWQLQNEGRRASVVIENEDLGRIKRASVPVIKYHGCVSRPGTMVATSTDFERLYEKTSLVRQLMAVSLAKSNVLVIGHGLADADLARLLDEMLADLKDYLPTIYIIREPSRQGEALSLNYRATLIYEDLTRFLSRVLHEHREFDASGGAAQPAFDEAWLDSAFFAQLRQVSVLPSETQVIDAFLAHLVEELVARGDVQSVREDARVAVERTLLERPNYGALRRTWDTFERDLEAAGDDLVVAEHAIRDHIEARTRKAAVFGSAGRDVIKRDDRLVVFSQSIRVIQALRGVSTATQRTVDVFVAECRPKSPAPYDDAAAICRQLADTSYHVTVCPDVVAINLLAEHQVSKVVMGTHAIYVDENDEPYAFVNTCGSLAISLAAERYDVPVIVIGEELKLERVPRAESSDHMYSHQEHDLLAAATGLADLATRREAVAHLNIGYDLVPMGAHVKLLVPDAVADS